jgi:hypothetical protein
LFFEAGESMSDFDWTAIFAIAISAVGLVNGVRDWTRPARLRAQLTKDVSLLQDLPTAGIEEVFGTNISRRTALLAMIEERRLSSWWMTYHRYLLLAAGLLLGGYVVSSNPFWNTHGSTFSSDRLAVIAADTQDAFFVVALTWFMLACIAFYLRNYPSERDMKTAIGYVKDPWLQQNLLAFLSACAESNRRRQALTALSRGLPATAADRNVPAPASDHVHNTVDIPLSPDADGALPSSRAPGPAWRRMSTPAQALVTRLLRGPAGRGHAS